MQNVSADFNRIFQSGKDKLNVEYRLVINDNDTYNQDQLINGTLTESLFGKFGMGNFVSKTLEISFLKKLISIPRSAKLAVECRISDGNEWSEWIPKGTFFTDTRKTQYGMLSLRAYDSALKANAVFIKTGEWAEITALALYEELCESIGVLQDANTVALITANNYTLAEAPDIGEEGTTIGEMFSYLGTLYGGNWTIDETMHMKLVQINGITYYYEYDASEDLDISDSLAIVDRVEIYTNTNSGGVLRYPDLSDEDWDAMTGHVLRGTSIFVNENNIADVYNRVVGTAYRGFSVGAVSENPALQIGDGVIFEDEDFRLVKRVITFGEDLSAMSAPYEEEIDNEYPYINPAVRETRQKSARNYARILTTEESIVSEVGRLDAEILKVEQTAEAFTIWHTIKDGETQSDADREMQEAAESAVDTYDQTVQTYLRYSSGVLELGETNSPFKAELDNTKLAFTGESGEDAAWISNNELYVNRMVVPVKNMGKWIQQTTPDGHFQIRWVAD